MSGQEREAWLQQQVIDRDRFIELDQAEIKRRGLRIEHLEAENARLRAALEPFAEHSLPGWDTQSRRTYRLFVTEGQVARAWMALHEHEA